MSDNQNNDSSYLDQFTIDNLEDLDGYWFDKRKNLLDLVSDPTKLVMSNDIIE